MSTEKDVARLMQQASDAPTYKETRSLISQADALRVQARLDEAQNRSIDLEAAANHVQAALTPVPVYERMTKESEWLHDVPDNVVDEGHIQAQATMWYSQTPQNVKECVPEFQTQAMGQSTRIASAYGASADSVNEQFLSHVATLHRRDLEAGNLTVTALGEGPSSPQVGEVPGSYPTDTFPTGNAYQGLPGELTSSERIPQLQELENNNSASSSSDVVPINDPGLGQKDTSVDQRNGDAGTESVADLPQGRQAARKESSMELVQCPMCAGHGKTAAARGAEAQAIWDHQRDELVRHATQPQQRKQAYSGLPQITQIIDPSDTEAEETPLPEQVAFPMTWDQNAIQRTIQQTEQQLAERDQRRGASRHNAAISAAQQVYRRILAGQDNSGWAGDMGAQGWSPGQQDGGNPGGPSNLALPDPVYGYGGDQEQRPVKPYGASEADDFTNDPGMNWQPGELTQYDQGGRQQQLQNGQDAPGFPNAPINRQSAIRPNYTDDAGMGLGRTDAPDRGKAAPKQQGPLSRPINTPADIASLSNGERGSVNRHFDISHSTGGEGKGIIQLTHSGPTEQNSDPNQVHQKLHYYDNKNEFHGAANQALNFAHTHGYGVAPRVHDDNTWSRVDRHMPEQDLF